jgi:hypothetical protein
LIHFPLIKQSVLLATHLPKVTKMEIKGGILLHNSNSNLKIIEEIAKYLPDLMLLVNELDEPRVLKNNPNRMGGDANHWGMDFDPEHNIYSTSGSSTKELLKRSCDLWTPDLEVRVRYSHIYIASIEYAQLFFGPSII